MRGRETERETDRQTDRDREAERDRDTETETQTQTQRQRYVKWPVHLTTVSFSVGRCVWGRGQGWNNR